MTKRKSDYRGIPDNPASHDSEGFSFFEAIKENLESILGHRPKVSVKKRMVTPQQLIDLGLITEDDLWKIK